MNRIFYVRLFVSIRTPLITHLFRQSLPLLKSQSVEFLLQTNRHNVRKLATTAGHGTIVTNQTIVDSRKRLHCWIWFSIFPISSRN